MKHSNPDNPETKQQTPNANQQSRMNKNIPESKNHHIISQNNTQTPNNSGHQNRYEWINLVIMIGILLVTGIYAVFAGLQWKTMQNQLTLTDRPWLKISLEIIAPLKFIKFQEKTLLRTSVSITVKNIGRSVATNIRLIVKFSSLKC